MINELSSVLRRQVGSHSLRFLLLIIQMKTNEIVLKNIFRAHWKCFYSSFFSYQKSAAAVGESLVHGLLIILMASSGKCWLPPTAKFITKKNSWSNGAILVVDKRHGFTKKTKRNESNFDLETVWKRSIIRSRYVLTPGTSVSNAPRDQNPVAALTAPVSTSSTLNTILSKKKKQQQQLD